MSSTTVLLGNDASSPPAAECEQAADACLETPDSGCMPAHLGLLTERRVFSTRREVAYLLQRRTGNLGDGHGAPTGLLLKPQGPSPLVRLGLVQEVLKQLVVILLRPPTRQNACIFHAI